jgi:hypothetical protein
MVPIATRHYSSDGRLTSLYPSLLQTTVATDVFCSSLLCYHYSDVVVAMDRLPVATMAYGSMLQCLLVVVIGAFIPEILQKTDCSLNHMVQLEYFLFFGSLWVWI